MIPVFLRPRLRVEFYPDGTLREIYGNIDDIARIIGLYTVPEPTEKKAAS